jgi:hypothetical protein
VHQRLTDTASLAVRDHTERAEPDRGPVSDARTTADDVPNDVAVHDSDNRQRRNDVPTGPQIIHQLSLGRVGTTAERGIVHRPHS